MYVGGNQLVGAHAHFLLQEHGGLDNAPEEIKATVVEMEQLTMSEV